VRVTAAVKEGQLSERVSMLTSEKVIDAINEPAFAEATARRGLHLNNLR
jgi:hypothetical protein